MRFVDDSWFTDIDGITYDRDKDVITFGPVSGDDRPAPRPDTDLKPCPFCGGAARVVVSVDMANRATHYAVQCLNCGVMLLYKHGEGHPRKRYETRRDVVRAWNTREKGGK